MIELSVIIPYHFETINEVDKLLTSLNSQVGVDFQNIEIILSNDLEDGSGNIKPEQLKKYSEIYSCFKFIKSQCKNNPGMSRQAAIDQARGDYVFFCDADDMLYSCTVLRELRDNIRNSNADIYQFKFMEEIGAPDCPIDKFLYNIKNYNWTWVFAKAYKVDFLRKNGIRFIPENRWHEDTYFNYLCKYCNAKMVVIESVGYLWRFNKNSITRINNHEYTFGSLDEYFGSITRAFSKVINEYKKNCSEDILFNILYYYHILTSPESLKHPKYEYMEKCYYDFIRTFVPDLFAKITPEISRELARIDKGVAVDAMPTITFEDYMQELKGKYRQ